MNFFLNVDRAPLIHQYSGGDTSGLESAYTSPSVHHKDFIEQYLNKLSYLPGDVITNSEPLGLGGDLGGIGSRSGPGGHGAPFNTTSYTSPFLTGAVTTTAAPGGGISGINDLLAETTMYNSFSSGKIFKNFWGLTRFCRVSIRGVK